MGTINIYNYVENTFSEGPGKRFTIWFQGCLKRCVGCCNEEMLSTKENNIMKIDEICRLIKEAKNNYNIEGITFLGGEPILQIYGLIEIAKFAQSENLTVMMFSGYLKREIEILFPEESKELFSNLDILIDGPFEIDKLDNSRRWIGSKNQKIHLFSNRYDMSIFEDTKQSVEIRIENEKIIINGWPYKKSL